MISMCLDVLAPNGAANDLERLVWGLDVLAWAWRASFPRQPSPSRRCSPRMGRSCDQAYGNEISQITTFRGGNALETYIDELVI